MVLSIKLYQWTDVYHTYRLYVSCLCPLPHQIHPHQILLLCHHRILLCRHRACLLLQLPSSLCERRTDPPSLSGSLVLPANGQCKCEHSITPIPITWATCLTLCTLGNVSCFFVVCCFFRNQFFQKILSGIPSKCQTDWIQIRPDILSGLIWVQTVCKC